MAQDGKPTGPGRRNAALSETLGRFSHDIRTAMSDVIGGLRLIDPDRLEPEARMQLDRVRVAGETLAELVDAALMAAAGETPLSLDEGGVELAPYLAELGKRWGGKAQSLGTRFEMEIATGLPEMVGLTRMQLDRMLGNLIGNALQHGAGPVLLSVSFLPDRALEFSVRDHGPGISERVKADLLSPSEHPGGARVPASGLGLRIVKELVENCGGAMTIGRSDAGGALVSLHVPQSCWRPGETGTEPAAMPDLSMLRILVAEDNPTNQVIVRQILDQMGSPPVVVSDGAEALAALDAAEFDIALVDIEMPGMDGLALLRAVRARQDAARDMPMVALTAYVLRDNREAIYAAGADGIIGKPIRSAGEFGQAILRHAGRPEPAPQGQTPDAAFLDESRFEALLEAAGPEGEAELLTHLGEDLEHVQRILADAVARRDLSEIRAQTHILVSLAGAVGAEALQRQSESLNLAAQRGRREDLAGFHGPVDDGLSMLRDRVAGRRGRVPR